MNKTFRLAAVAATVSLLTVVGFAIAADFRDTTNWVNSSGTTKASVTRDGVATLSYVRPIAATQLSAADVNLAKATIQGSNYFPVSTSANAVDVDFADDAALDSADIGSRWVFMVATGHATNALTVTAGASGVTTVTTLNAAAGSSCEDERDHIECIAEATTAIVCRTFCAD